MPTKIVKCLRGLCLADLSRQNLAAITETLTRVLLNNISNQNQIFAKSPTRNAALLFPVSNCNGKYPRGGGTPVNLG